VGTPVDGVDVSLTGESDGSGTVSVASDAVALGYFPAREEESPRLAGGRFTTEDLARFEGPELFLLGRKSDWINVKGKKVNPREVEAVLHQLEGVRDAVVLAWPVPGRSGEIVRAVVAGAGLDWRRVVDWCRPRLSSHKVPRSVILVDEIPRNARGKVDRDALLALGPEDAGTRSR
jgi:long-chain acyl-CoA synthetase